MERNDAVKVTDRSGGVKHSNGVLKQSNASLIWARQQSRLILAKYRDFGRPHQVEMAESNIQSGEIAVPEMTTQTLFEITSVQRIARKDLGLLARGVGFKPHSWQFSNSGMERDVALKVTETTEKNEDINGRVKRQEDAHELKRSTRIRT
jgi:hypothetical protein